jgi:hypothetical protein
MTSQQEADCALALWQSHKGDDQERMDSILKEFFAQVRADEYEVQLRLVSEEMALCPVITKEFCA